MNTTDTIICGVTGTSLSATGTAVSMISLNELQAILGIICTVLGFIISVVTPVIIKLINKIKEAKKDGHISADEAVDIANTVKEGVDQVKESLDKKDSK